MYIYTCLYIYANNNHEPEGQTTCIHMYIYIYTYIYTNTYIPTHTSNTAIMNPQAGRDVETNGDGVPQTSAHVLTEIAAQHIYIYIYRTQQSRTRRPGEASKPMVTASRKLAPMYRLKSRRSSRVRVSSSSPHHGIWERVTPKKKTKISYVKEALIQMRLRVSSSSPHQGI